MSCRGMPCSIAGLPDAPQANPTHDDTTYELEVIGVGLLHDLDEAHDARHLGSRWARDCMVI